MKRLVNNSLSIVFLFHASILLSQNYFAAVEKDSLYSFIDTSGKHVLGPYKNLPLFSEGLAFVHKDSIKGYINLKGEFQIKFGWEFLWGDEFHEGLASVFFGDKRLVFSNYKYKRMPEDHFDPEPDKSVPVDTVTYGKRHSHGYINKEGKMVIRAAYDAAGEFKEGMARVCNGCSDMYFRFKGGKFGFIDHNGKVIVPLIYSYDKDFHEGLALVVKDSLSGFIDHEGRVVIPIKYISATSFISDRAFVERKKGVSMLINKKGECIKKIPGLDKCGYFYEEVCPIMINDSLVNPNKKGKRMMLIDRNGNTVTELDCDYILSFREGLAAAYKNKKRGFIDKKGQWVIPPLFESVRDFSHGLAAAKLNGKWGYIDKKGNWKIQPVYDFAYEFVKAD